MVTAIAIVTAMVDPAVVTEVTATATVINHSNKALITMSCI